MHALSSAALFVSELSGAEEATATAGELVPEDPAPLAEVPEP